MSHVFVSRVGGGEQVSWLSRGKHEMYKVFGQETSWKCSLAILCNKDTYNTKTDVIKTKVVKQRASRIGIKVSSNF